MPSPFLMGQEQRGVAALGLGMCTKPSVGNSSASSVWPTDDRLGPCLPAQADPLLCSSHLDFFLPQVFTLFSQPGRSGSLTWLISPSGLLLLFLFPKVTKPPT
jgi:hypothetical protein